MSWWETKRLYHKCTPRAMNRSRGATRLQRGPGIVLILRVSAIWSRIRITYGVFAAIGTGVEKLACCHPEWVSLVNVTLASLVPAAVHRVPTCVPVLLAPL